MIADGNLRGEKEEFSGRQAREEKKNHRTYHLFSRREIINVNSLYYLRATGRAYSKHSKRAMPYIPADITR